MSKLYKGYFKGAGINKPIRALVEIYDSRCTSMLTTQGMGWVDVELEDLVLFQEPIGETTDWGIKDWYTQKMWSKKCWSWLRHTKPWVGMTNDIYWKVSGSKWEKRCRHLPSKELTSLAQLCKKDYKPIQELLP